MGLDMYLEKHVYIGGEYEHRNVRGAFEGKIGDREIKIDAANISETIIRAGYWRKANQIHAWFVKNVQDGKDNCQTTEVSLGQLQELKALCEKALKDKDASLLPPRNGFFFGGTAIDEYYWKDLEDTIDILSRIPAEREPDTWYTYHSSW